MSLIPLDRWHLEITSKCEIACERCMRTEKRGTFKITDLNIELIDSVFSNLPSDKNREVLLCGSRGDAIYHENFHGVVKTLKKHGLRVHLNTNGSGFSQNWWQKTLSYFDESDSIILSIDGLADTNHIYRKGSQFETIEQLFPLIATARPSFIWKYIVFRHNQHQIDQARELAARTGFAEFLLTRSNRFGTKYNPQLTNDHLEPNEKYVSDYISRARGERDTMRPLCLSRGNIFSRGIYITAEGYMSLCCWTGANFTTNPFIENRDDFDLNRHNVIDIFERFQSSPLFASLTDHERAPSLCRRFCSYNKNETVRPERTNTNSYHSFPLQSTGLNDILPGASPI